MRRRERLLRMGLVILLLIAGKVGYETYRWWVHDEERARIGLLSGELEDVAVEVVSSQLNADSLRREIEGMDEALQHSRSALVRFEVQSVGGSLPARLFAPYSRELERHNRGVVARNAVLQEWREAVQRNHAAVGRYNALADSIRATAAEMGEPYYPIPTPAEVAVERGIEPPR